MARKLRVRGEAPDRQRLPSFFQAMIFSTVTGFARARKARTPSMVLSEAALRVDSTEPCDRRAIPQDDDLFAELGTKDAFLEAPFGFGEIDRFGHRRLASSIRKAGRKPVLTSFGYLFRLVKALAR